MTITADFLSRVTGHERYVMSNRPFVGETVQLTEQGLTVRILAESVIWNDCDQTVLLTQILPSVGKPRITYQVHNVLMTDENEVIPSNTQMYDDLDKATREYIYRAFGIVLPN